ncbi:hypothetical protein LINPERHAP1_LOCUS4417 [Linum perenne]
MSGGVGANHTQDQHNPKPKPRKPQFTLLTFYQLNSLAATLILASTGLIPISDFTFVILSFPYLFLLSKFAFPPLPPSPSSSDSSIVDKGVLFRLYVFLSFLLGILLPVAYILHGIIHGDRDGIKAAAPHVFLLASQLFMEGVAMSSGRFSLPVGIFVPVLYNSRRIFTLADWIRSEFEKSDEFEFGGSGVGIVGKVLAVANLGFWGYNLFGFLLPVYLPRVFRRYYSSSSSSAAAE